MQIEIRPSHLLAASHIMATKNVRYYLNGICVEALPNETRVHATDERVACSLRQDATNAETVAFIIPADVIKTLLPQLRKADVATITTGEPRHTLEVGGLKTEFAAIDGKYPDVRQVYPKTPSGEPSQIDPELLARFAKVAKALHTQPARVYVRHNGTDPALVQIGGRPAFAGVVMPLRETAKAPWPELTTWQNS